ncbi:MULTISPECIES: glutamate racemase [unclassified Prochlorococcus]|uniref:glutamate racemase n=1 Tax=unclassified Prochlorococcus TaxID=2627481 RepID=UPI000533B6EE|nr:MULTISPECIES: glutamate racemase [unclassified Prochlorococcus]KGG15367.1 Glutamate racemase [Prochlorococcus sp. MIT 0602]KGG17645.1 Glutamate racemase [Prochlorococcus sp. MIT 0603]
MKLRLALFDSGLGGLSVLQSIKERHNNFNAIYLADTARVPYGSKTPSEIRDIAFKISQWLHCQDVNAVVVACNTTNSLALDVIKQNVNVPVFDLIGSLSGILKVSKVGILATPLTVDSLAYTKEIHSFSPSTYVIEEACPDLVPIIEKGNLNSPEITTKVYDHLAPLLKADVEAIVLGCSHYPLIKPVIRKLIPSHISVINPASGLAKKMDPFFNFSKIALDSLDNSVDIQFCVTSDPMNFTSRVAHMLEIKPQVEVVSLHSKSCVY